MESWNNSGKKALTSYFNYQMMHPISEKGHILFELLAKGASWKPPNKLGYCQVSWLFSANDN